jgi:glutaredoxin
MQYKEMAKTLNHYNRRRKTKTQRRRKHRGGIKYQALSHYPGQIHNFDRASNNLAALDSMMMHSQTPVLVRHHRESCPHCDDFKRIWKAIETSAKGHPDFSVASLDDWATDHMDKTHYSRHGYSVSGVPTVVMIDRDRVPNEHTGPNTLEALEEFLKKHGMQLKIVPMEDQEQGQRESQYEQPDSAVASSESQPSETPLDESQSQPQSQPSDAQESQPQASGSLSDRRREKMGAVDKSIGAGVENITSALTEPINFNNLFATDASKTPTANAFPDVPLVPPTDAVVAAVAPPTDAVAPAPPAPPAPPAAVPAPSLSDNNQIIGAPQVPSIAGGKKHRRNNKKSKKKSKHSSKKRSKRRSNK